MSNSRVGLLAAVLLLALVFSCWMPWSTFFVAIVLIGLGIFAATRGVKAGGGALLCGVLLLGLSIVTLRVSGCMATHREEKEIQLANAEVAEHVKLARDFFGKGDVESAEGELTKAAAIAKATERQEADSLRTEIQRERQDSLAAKANLDVMEKVTRAGWSFDTGALENAEQRLQDALAVPNATDTQKAQELLAKVQTALAEKRRKLANEQVAKLVASASEALTAGDLDKAEQLVNEAHLVQNATEKQKAVDLLTTIRSAQAERLFRTAEQYIEEKKFPAALNAIRNYLSHPGRQNNERVEKLAHVLEVVVDDGRAREAAKAMTDSQLTDFATRSVLPQNLTIDNPAITDALEGALAKHISSERDQREQARLAQIEKQRLEKERKTEAEKSSGIVDLNAHVQFTGEQFMVANKDSFDWTNVKLEVNFGLVSSGYILKVPIVKAYEIFTVGAMQFAKKGGERFNPFTQKPQKFSIWCDTPKGKGSYIGGWE